MDALKLILKQISNRKGDAICQNKIFSKLMWFYTNFANWHSKIEKEIQSSRKQIENKVSSLEDYAVEVIQETEKIFAMGQRKFNPLIKKKKKKKTKQWKMNRLANKIIINNKNKQIPPIRCKRKACNNKKTNNYY
jgi:hypothetical protein